MTVNPMAWEGSVNPKVCFPSLTRLFIYYFQANKIHQDNIVISFASCILQVNTMKQAQDCLLPMGITSENVAHRFGVTRAEQDQAAVSSIDVELFCDSVMLFY